MAVNANYNTFPKAHYIEQVFGEKFRQVGESSNPLWWYIRQGQNASFVVENRIGGPSIALLPVALENASAAGQTYTGEWPGALSFSAPTQKNTFAEYAIAGIKTNFQLTSRDMAADQAHTRASRFAAEVDAALARMRNKIAADVYGNANASESNLLGIHYATVASNTDVGNINDALFLPFEMNVGAALTLPLVRKVAHAADKWRAGADAVDVLLFDNASANNLWTRFQELADAKLTFISSDDNLAMGKITRYAGAAVFSVSAPATGHIYGLQSSTWVIASNEDLTGESFMMQTTPVPGTTLTDYTFSTLIVWGTNDRAQNGRAYNVTVT